MAWNNATPEEQQRRTEAGADTFASLSSDRKDVLKELGKKNCHLGAQGGTTVWADATPERREKRIEDVTTHSLAFQNLAETTGQDRANAQIVLLLQLLGLGIFLIELYL